MPSNSGQAKIRLAGISESPLDVGQAVSLVSGPTVGGIALFVGTVRNRDHGQMSSRSTTPNTPVLLEVLQRCADETADQHDVLTIAVEHRIGHLEVGDVAVVVAVGAVHRGEALAACAHLINTLKAEVPIWKEQHFASGDSEWVGLPGEEGVVQPEPFDELRTPVDAQQGAFRRAQGAVG